jgi:hypothetical protein
MASLGRILTGIKNAETAGDTAAVAELTKMYNDREMELYGNTSGSNSDSSFFEDITSGFGAGAVGMAETAALGAAAFYEEEEELKARAKIQSVAESFRPEGGDKDSLTYGISSALGSIAGIAAPAAIAAYSAPAAAATAVGTGVAGLLGVGAARGEASERARAAGATEEERNKAINSILVNAAGVAEALPMGRVFKSIDVPILNKFIDRLSPEAAEGISGRLKNAAITGGVEGTQEVASEIAQNLTEQEYNALAETFGGARESFTMGAAAGAILDLFLGKRARGGATPDADPQETVVAEEGTTIEEETARDARNEEQIDMFSAELDYAEIADLERGEVGPTEEDIVRENERRAGERIETGATEQIDMLDQTEYEDIQAEEDAKIAGAQADADAETRLRQESDLESVAGRVEGRAVSESNARRKSILQEVIEANPTTNYNTVKRKFTEALSNEGLTDNKANEREALTIQKAVNFQKAEEGTRLTAGVDRNTDTFDMEAQIPERRGADRTGEDSGFTTDPNEAGSRDGLEGSSTNVEGAGTLDDTASAVQTVDARMDAAVSGAETTGRGKKGASASISPAAFARAEANKVDTSKITGTGKNGRITIGDVNGAIKAEVSGTSVGKPRTLAGAKVKGLTPDTTALVEKITGKKLITPKPDVDVDVAAVDTSTQTESKTSPVRTLNPKTNKFKFKNSEQFINRHPALDQDRLKLETLMGATLPRQTRTDIEFTDAAKEGQTQARTVKRYLEQFDDVDSALINAVSEASDPENKKYREPNEAKEKEPSGTLPVGKDPLAKNLAGTGGNNAKAVLAWAKDNLSAETNTQLDSRFKAAKERAEVAKDSRNARGTKAAEDKLKSDREARENAARAKRKADAEADISNDAKFKATDSKADLAEQKLAAARKKELKGANKTAAVGKKSDKKKVQSASEKRLALLTSTGKRLPSNPDAPNTGTAKKTSKQQQKEQLAVDTAAFIVSGGKINYLLEIDPKEIAALNNNLSGVVKELIKKGDLKGALQEVSKTSKNKRIKQVARALAANMGDTKIVMGEIDGDGVGLYNSNANTITLDPNKGTTVHALLHESTHAATVNILNNKSHPLTKQLTKLYEDTKGSLDTVYGAESLAEFVSEAFSNPAFQRRLASINPKGSPISTLQRFFRAVTNYVRGLIGMETKPVGSALESVDAAIMAILAPSMESAGIGSLDATREGVVEVLSSMAVVQKTLKSGLVKPFVDSAVEYLGDAGVYGGGKEFFLKLTGSQALGDIARRYGFGDVGIRLHAAYEKMRGDTQDADKKIKERLDSYDAWVKDAGREQAELLDNIVYSEEHGATIYQVDPTKQRSDYKGKTDESGNDLEAVWVAQQEQWKKLKPEGRAMFTEQRNEYKRLHKELVKVINGEIDALEANIDPNDKEALKAFKDKQVSLKKQINQKLLEAGELEVYFPLVRQGKYKLSFDSKVTNKETGETKVESVFLMFDRKVDRDNMLADVKADSNTVGDPDAYNGDTKRSSFNNPPSGSFVSDVLAVVNAGIPKGKDSTATQEQIMRLFIESLPETSFAKSLQKRKGTLGYDKNVRGAMQNKGYDLSAQIQKMKSAAIIRVLEKEVINIERPSNIDLGTFDKIKNELLVRSQFARTGATNKTSEKYFQRANQLAFIYTIGFNASSALVNMSQIPLVVGPFLSAKFGYAETTMAMAKASKFVGASKISIDEYYDITDVENADGSTTKDYTLKPSMEKKIRDGNPKEADADAAVAEYVRMIPLVKAANARGQIYHSEIKDQLRANEGTSKNPALKMLDSVSTLSAVMFSTAERFNRQTTLSMSYNLVLDKLDALHTSKEGRYYSAVDAKFIDVPSSSQARMDFAAKEALYLTQETNGGSVLETAAGYSQQNIGRVALMYKSYGLQMYYSMLKAGKLAAENMFAKDAEGKQLRTMALKQVAGIHGSALFFAGVQGVPLYGAVSMFFDLFLLDDEEDDFDTAVRKHIGEGWYKGAVTELTGVDVAGRVRLTGLLLQENRFNKDASLEENLAFYLGGPALSTANRLYRGVEDLHSGDIGSVERGIENLAPAGVTNAYRNTLGRYKRQGGIDTRRGDPIYDDMTGGDFAAYALGFPPSEYTFIQERTARNKGVEAAITTKRTRLTKQFYIANRMGDYEKMGELVDEMVEHNKRHPVEAITPTNIMTSFKAHMKTSANMHNGVTVSPLMKHAIMVSNMEYSQ